jgi:hypothetical protein
LARQQAVLDQPGGAAVPRIVRTHAKISRLVENDGAGSGVTDLKPHRVFRPADSRHDPDKGLLGAEAQSDAGIAAVAVAQSMRLHGFRISAADIDKAIAPRLRNQPARLVGDALQFLGIGWVPRQNRASGAEIFQLEIEQSKFERRRIVGACGECEQQGRAEQQGAGRKRQRTAPARVEPDFQWLLPQDLTVSKIAGCWSRVYEDICGSQTNDLSFSSALHALLHLDTINAAGFQARTSCISFEVPNYIRGGFTSAIRTTPRRSLEQPACMPKAGLFHRLVS